MEKVFIFIALLFVQYSNAIETNSSDKGSGDVKAKSTATLTPIISMLLDSVAFPKTVTLTPRANDTTILRPAKGESVIDDVFGTKITRIDKNDTAIANYPKTQSWNQNVTLLRIGSRIYHANSLSETSITEGKTISEAYSTLCSRSSDYFRWSNQVPNRFFVMNSSFEFIQGQINGDSVDCSNVLDEFEEYEEVHIGPHEGNIDYNDRYVVFAARKPADITFYIILFDIINETRVWTKTIDDNQWVFTASHGWQPTYLDWISVSPSGKYIVTNEITKANYQEGLYRYDINFADARKLQYDYQGTLYSEGGHGDIGYDINNNEVVVQFMTGLGVHSFNLDNPDELGKKLLISPYGGGHVSCRNTRRKGWCYITTHQSGYKRVFALKLDGTLDQTVQNYSQSHIHSNYPETYGAPNPDGSNVIFNSNWGNASEVVDTYLVEAQ